MRKIILPALPKKYGRYIEVFGGGASILLAKERSKFEVYNDFNSDLVNMFRCIKERPLSFFRVLEMFPLHSRQEFNILLDFMNSKKPNFSNVEEEILVAKELFNERDSKEFIKILNSKAELYDVERAVTFYKLIRYSYGSGGKSFGGQPVNLENVLTNIYAVSQRMQKVVIENRDFEDIIRIYDRPDAFFYIDPPYVSTEGYYMGGFGREDHLRLYHCLLNIKGMFMLSYNSCEFIKELYKEFMIIEETRTNPLAHKFGSGSEFKELLITNYDANERRKSLPQQLSFFGVDKNEEQDILQDYRQKRENNFTAYISYKLRDHR